MENEILIALVTKLVEDRIAEIPVVSGHRGPRGPVGPAGQDGKGFVFEEHEEKIRSWAKEFALKFEDLSEEQIQKLRGPRGRDGVDGKDGDDFKFEEHRERIHGIIREAVGEIRDSLRLKFSDLDESEINELRGPRGRDGRDGRDFDFDEHREFFESLRLRFSDLTDEEKDSLKLHFSQLTEEEKSSLKLKFSDLTEDERALIRGPRGVRGQRGSPGRDGAVGPIGPIGPRGLPGPRGIAGLVGKDGKDGKDGVDGKDAPVIVAIDIDEVGDDIVFVFEFSDGSIIRSDRIKLPAPVNVYNGGGGVGRKAVSYETRIDEVDATLTYVGKANPGSDTDQNVWQIQRILVVGSETVIEFADGNAEFDNVWDNRASLTYS